MNCQEINFLLDANPPGEPGVREREAVDRHFESCHACREAWAAYCEVSALRIPPTPQSLRSRIVAALAPAEARAMRGLIVGSMLAVGAAVAAAVAVRMTDVMSDVAQTSQEPAADSRAASPVGSERLPVAANRVYVPTNAENPTEANGSTSRITHALDPNSIVVLPVPHPELDARRAALFARFHEEILRRLRDVPGLNVVRPELVDPFAGSGIPEEQVARNLGAGRLVVLSTTPEPSARLNITPVDMETGAATGSMSIRPPFDSRWPADLASDAATVVDFITPSGSREREAALGEARSIVLNSALPAIERVKALGKLRRIPEARTDELVAAAVELATIAPEARAAIWFAVYGVDNPYLLEPLLDSLAYDRADHGRSAAAAALRTFVAEPRVQAALQQSKASDASEAVREAARRALLTDEERDRRALETVIDETLPARERLAATMLYTDLYVHEVPLTDEAARAVFDIGTKSTDPEIRAMAWGKLGRSRVDDPGFTGVLLDDLANYPSDSVRRMAANALKQYTHDSTVRAALEQAERDPSLEVRYAARWALGEVPQ